MATAARVVCQPRKLLIFGIFLILPLAFGMLLSLAFVDTTGLPTSAMDSDPVDSIVGLRNGATLLAPSGTVARDIANWLNAGRPGSRIFVVGGNRFDGESDRLTLESNERLERLAVMLKANDDVRVTVIAPGDSEASRARKVVKALIADGIGASRLAIETGSTADQVEAGLSILLSRPATGAA